MNAYFRNCCALLVSLFHAAAAPHPIANATNSQLNLSLEISLFAAEPDVVDPVALTFDESGRMYVVEMRDYPYGFGPQRKPGGTVRLLEDTNHDGKADQSTLFAENLSFPTSICPWNGGVLVTCPPEIIFLKDTDGDGRADVREVMFKGFTLGVTDSNVNGSGGDWTIASTASTAGIADASFHSGNLTSHFACGYGLQFRSANR